MFSASAAGPSKSGDIKTASGGNVSTRKRVSPGSGTKLVTSGVGSVPLNGMAVDVEVDQIIRDTNPGIVLNMSVRGTAPSWANLAAP
jgi:hypothetical protein